MSIACGIMEAKTPLSTPESEAACSVCSRVVIAWECGSCKMTNEDMMHRHCHICGEQHPICYLLIGGPIEPAFGGRRWWGRCTKPINAMENNNSNEVKSKSVSKK